MRQLIKELIPFFAIFRCLPKARSHERLRSNEQHPIVTRRKTISTPSSEINSSRSSHHSQKNSCSLTQLRDPEKKESLFTRINSFPTRHRSEIDSLDSNYQNRTAANSVCRVSEEDLSYSEVGLSLPNYYPDSKCDTDASLTDNISVEDRLETGFKSIDRSDTEKPIRKTTEQLLVGQSDSIPYDENIVLSKNTPLYDSLGNYNYGQSPFKPRTIRGSTPYHRNTGDYSGKPHSLPNFTTSTITYDSDSSLSNCSLKYYECENSKDNLSNPREYVQSDTNFDEIKLTNDKIKILHRDKVTENIIYDSKSECSNIENNPVYDEISKTSHIKEINSNASSTSESKEELTTNSLDSNGSISKKSSVLRWTNENNSGSTIKTSVKVPAADNELDTSSEEYKTVVSIDTDDKASSCFSSKNSPLEKKHSHSYLRDFLESQRGSKKPLQNYLSKKISRAFGDRSTHNSPSTDNKTEIESNLFENQYYSLPDITIGKNLRKCEKIDRKLRKCENVKITKAQTDSTNRFIVNIGRHFDLTAQSNIPIDFEVKISKIPKGQTSKHKTRTEIKANDSREKSFLEAVRTLKETLNSIDETQNITRPEIVAVKTKCGINEEINQANIKHKKESKNKSRSNSLRISNRKELKIGKRMEDIRAINQEYQEKVGTIRNYWDKMAYEAAEKYEEKNENEKDEVEENQSKLIDTQTKVDEIKSKFESSKEISQKQYHSKVQLAKELFEYKSRNEKNGNVPDFIRECREIFENPYFEKDNSNQFESLNPNIVEIIENEERGRTASLKENDDTEHSKTDSIAGNKIRKPVIKSKSITSEPEFDHVRYRVMKSDVFQKKIFANCDKESQFDGLMQYLQDYSFQELLIDNNIVIIEPIRSNIKYEPRKKSKTSRNITQLVHKTKTSDDEQTTGIKRHFFYHPIRVNREVNDDELPNPDTVKQVRQFFECGLKKSVSTRDLEEIAKNGQYKEIDPDKDRCSTTTDTNSTTSAMSDYGSSENLFDTLDDFCCDHYISEDALEKIREKGTTITYYGGRILNKYNGKSISLTKAIMDEIRRNQKSNECGCMKNSDGGKGIIFTEETGRNKNKDQYQGIKFKLLKSNSCSSRLELVGEKNLSEYRNKYLMKQKQLIDEHNKKKQEALKETNQEDDFTEMAMLKLQTNKQQDNNDTKMISFVDKNVLNENIKQQSEKHISPKIIGGEMKSTKSKDDMCYNKINDDTPTITNVTLTQPTSKINYDYSLESVRRRQHTDMEFEPYEVAN